MKQKIIQKLKELEVEQDIKILLAVETGSRAWGFASPDSDYDIRLIYVKEADWYIKLSEGKDHLQYMSEDGEIDLTGWELRKALRLLAKSNAAMLERIQSPIVYIQEGDFANEMIALSKEFCSPVALIHHYSSMAIKSFDTLKNPERYFLKALFYALRATCACHWIMQKGTNPPIVFSEMLVDVAVPESVKSRIAELTELKATKGEGYLHAGEQELLKFISSSLVEIRKAKPMLKGAKGKMENLDVFLRSKIVR